MSAVKGLSTSSESVSYGLQLPKDLTQAQLQTLLAKLQAAAKQAEELMKLFATLCQGVSHHTSQQLPMAQ